MFVCLCVHYLVFYIMESSKWILPCCRLGGAGDARLAAAARGGVNSVCVSSRGAEADVGCIALADVHLFRNASRRRLSLLLCCGLPLQPTKEFRWVQTGWNSKPQQNSNGLELQATAKSNGLELQATANVEWVGAPSHSKIEMGWNSKPQQC